MDSAPQFKQSEEDIRQLILAACTLGEGMVVSMGQGAAQHSTAERGSARRVAPPGCIVIAHMKNVMQALWGMEAQN